MLDRSTARLWVNGRDDTTILSQCMCNHVYTLLFTHSHAHTQERAGHGIGSMTTNSSTPTTMEYHQQPSKRLLDLSQEHHRACVCYRKNTDIRAMMEHRLLPVINGVDRIEYPGGDVFVGELADRQRHGKGIHTFSNGSKYWGHFWKGKVHGVGECLYRLGGLYRGEFYVGLRQGYGSYIYSTTWVKEEMEEYVGGWVGDAPMGWGLLTFKNGDVYLGGFRDGVFDGPGCWCQGEDRA